jgi:glycerate kinase
MKILIAPDKFKDCLSAADVAGAIADGIRSVDPSIEIDSCPMADGGEGTVAALVAATGGTIHTRKVTGPLASTKVDAPVGILGDGKTAVVEMASASGLYLLQPDQRDPTRTTSFGTGELLRAASELGATRIILGIGGSATVDGGIGCAQAWGVRFSLASGQTYSVGDRKLTGGDLLRLRSVEPAGTRSAGNGGSRRGNRPGSSPRAKSTRALPDSSPRQFINTRNIEFIVACDVGNPLLGENGAANIFGPQKGATPEQVAHLEEGLSKLVERTGRADLADQPGAGAAGGLGFGMMAFFGAALRPGIDIVIEATRLRERLAGADLCITGEGKFDAQSLAGKTTIGVARLCHEMNIPCIAIAGSIGAGAEQSFEHGITSYFSICDHPMGLNEAIERAPELIKSQAANILRAQISNQRRRTC